MPKVQIDCPGHPDPRHNGLTTGYSTRVMIDGIEQQDVRELDLRFAVDEAVTAKMSMFVRAPFSFVSDNVKVITNLYVLPGFVLISEPLPDGRTKWTAERTVPAISINHAPD